MIELETGKGDSHEFLHLASKLIEGAAIVSDPPPRRGVWVARVDGFFGQAWLGFRGKLLGQLGVRNRSFKDDLALPRFYYDRILSVRYFTRDDRGGFTRAEPPWPRWLGCGSSKRNVNRDIVLQGAYAWYSTGSEDTGKGAVMVYAIKEGPNAAWYTMWENKPPWRLTRKRSRA